MDALEFRGLTDFGTTDRIECKARWLASSHNPGVFVFSMKNYFFMVVFE